MSTLHTMGCSITQGFALPDVVKPILNDQGHPLTVPELIELEQQGTQTHWEDIHLYQASQWAWPQLLADRLGITVQNHARRGACFQQIARQCAVALPHIQPQDVVIVMWTYLCRLSLQWPGRTAVPFCNVVDPNWGWHTVIKGFNRLLGLSRAAHSTQEQETVIQQHIKNTAELTHLTPLGQYNSYHNAMLLLCMTDGCLRSTGARVIHLSVEPEPYPRQLESVRQQLDATLHTYTAIPDPTEWYHTSVDHKSCRVILDPSIPPAENDMHPSQQHHRNFAAHLHQQYFAPMSHS
jgi:hypothetical protein